MVNINDFDLETWWTPPLFGVPLILEDGLLGHKKDYY